MPSSSRGVWPPRLVTLRTGSLYPRTTAVAWPTLAANTLWGATVTAVADPNQARVRVEVYWPGALFAQVRRVHPDGSVHLVRGGDPALVATGWARYDYEAPFDLPVTYQVSSGGAAWETDGPVTLAVGTQAWLTHPFQPHLSRVVAIRAMSVRTAGARRGIARPLDRDDPIVVHQIRQTEAGTVALKTNGTLADLDAMRDLIADGAPLLLRRPGIWGGESIYISINTTHLERWAERLPTAHEHLVTLPFDVVDRPEGAAYGGPGDSYADLNAAWHVYEALAAGEPSYLDLALTPGP